MRSAFILLIAIGTSVAAAQSWFPDIPDNHWVYETFASLRKMGIGSGLRETHGPQDYTKSEFSASVIKVTKHLVSIEGYLSPDHFDEQSRVDLESGFALQEALPSLSRMTRVFEADIRKVGEDPSKLRSQLHELSERIQRSRDKFGAQVRDYDPGNFRDVPRGHWAARAVRELKQLGILDGYPDGSYKG